MSAFAAAGELFKPKRFSGMSAAAPSVAIATLALTYSRDGAADIAVEARSMILGAIALFVCCAFCVMVAKARSVPMWLTAFAGWVVWITVALGLWEVGRRTGRLP